MKQVKLSDVHHQMAVELSKKLKMPLQDFLEELIHERYNNKRKRWGCEMEVKRSLHEIEERLEFYYSRLHSLDEESREDQSSIHYLKDQISFWKKELLKIQEKELFGEVEDFFLS